jgi:hypothetical protein
MSELLPIKTVALEYVDCTDDSREYEFNRWYNRVHVPDLVHTPGVLGVHRYRNEATDPGEGQTRYLTVYHINSDDPWGLMQKVTQQDHRRRADEGRMIDCFASRIVTVWDFLAYRRTVSPLLRPETHLPDGMPEAMLVVPTVCSDASREEEFYDWYLYTHFHDLLETPGFVQAHRYRSLNPAPREGEARYLALYEIDSDDPAGAVRRIGEGDTSTLGAQGRMIDCIRAPQGMGTYKHIDL